MATSVVKSTPAGLHCLSKKKKKTFNNLSHVKTNKKKKMYQRKPNVTHIYKIRTAFFK